MFSYLGLGVEMVGAVKEIRELRQVKKDYPDDYPILDDFFRIFSEVGLTPRTKIPGQMAVMSEKRIKGIRSKDMRCAASVFPDQKNIATFFIPDVPVHDSSYSTAAEFVALANANLPVGCVNITGTRKNFVGNNSLTFNYVISMSYKDILRPSKKLLGNMIRNLLDSTEFLPRCLEKMQAGVSASDIFKVVPLTGKEPKPKPVKSTNFLRLALKQCIQAEGLARAEKPITRLAYVTDQNQIVFETRLQTIADLEARRRMMFFMVMINQNVAWDGRLTMNPADGVVAYKTSIDALGVENEISTGIVKNMIRENQAMCQFLYSAIQEVVTGTPLDNVMKGLERQAREQMEETHFEHLRQFLK